MAAFPPSTMMSATDRLGNSLLISSSSLKTSSAPSLPGKLRSGSILTRAPSQPPRKSVRRKVDAQEKAREAKAGTEEGEAERWDLRALITSATGGREEAAGVGGS